jgi:hypothetical protein
VLVGRSYSGAVITVAGASDKVAGLVYVTIRWHPASSTARPTMSSASCQRVRLLSNTDLFCKASFDDYG